MERSGKRSGLTSADGIASGRKAASVRAHSAGGVVCRETPDGLEVLTIRPRGQDRWQLPKGTVERGESAIEAAVREVREEGGVHAAVLAALEPISYYFVFHGRRIHKTVEFFVMRYLSGDPGDHDEEVDEARWIPVAEAGMLTFESEQALVRSAVDIVRGT